MHNNLIKPRKKVSIKALDVTDKADEGFPAQEHRLDNNLLEEGFFLESQQICLIYQCILTGFVRC